MPQVARIMWAMKHLMILALLAATPAAAFQSQNNMHVTPDGPSGFEVSYRGGRAGVSDFWCAAGDYVVRGLNRPGDTKIYRTTSVPRRAGEDMRFSLSPEGAKPTGILTLIGQTNNVTAARARFMCEIRRR